MKRKTTRLAYPTTRAARDPAVDVVTAYASEPTGGSCAGHPGVATVMERNASAPGWHCKFCHAMPETKGEADVLHNE